MRITKLEHAALIVEEGSHRLVIDPGAFTTPITNVSGVDAILVTHAHPDHWTPEQLNRLLGANPTAQIYGPAGVARAAADFTVNVVAPGDTVEVGPFTLRFFGGTHAEIHRSIPLIDNVGVLVNDRLYYPGDSFAIPDGVEVDTLAAPAGAPWLKISEVIDFVAAIAPKRSFSVHEGVLSAAGKGIANERIGAATVAAGGEFFALQPDESLDI